VIIPQLATILLGTGLVVTISDELPKLDVMPSCRAATMVPPANLQSCLKDEETARTILAGTWSQFAAGDRATCTRDNSIGGLSSYVVLQTCLQIARDARKLERGQKN
jgi:hypothetical protein